MRPGLLALLSSARAPAEAARVVSLNLCADDYLVMLAPSEAAALSALAADPRFPWWRTRRARCRPCARTPRRCWRCRPDLVLAGPYGAADHAGRCWSGGGCGWSGSGCPPDFAAIAAEARRWRRAARRAGAGGAHCSAACRRSSRPSVRGRAGAHRPDLEARGYAAGPGTLADAVLRAAGSCRCGRWPASPGWKRLLVHPPDLLVVRDRAPLSLARHRTASTIPALARHPAPHHPAGAAVVRRPLDRGGRLPAGALMRLLALAAAVLFAASLATGAAGLIPADPMVILLADPAAARGAGGAGRRRARPLRRGAAGRAAQPAGRSGPARHRRVRRRWAPWSPSTGGRGRVRAGPAAGRAGRGGGRRRPCCWASPAGRRPAPSLILAGVALSAVTAALLALALTLAPNPFALAEITFWLMGGLDGPQRCSPRCWPRRRSCSAAPCCSGWAAGSTRWRSGEEVAASLGVPVGRTLRLAAVGRGAGGRRRHGGGRRHRLRRPGGAAPAAPWFGERPARAAARLAARRRGAACRRPTCWRARRRWCCRLQQEPRLGVLTALLGAPFLVRIARRAAAP